MKRNFNLLLLLAVLYTSTWLGLVESFWGKFPLQPLVIYSTLPCPHNFGKFHPLRHVERPIFSQMSKSCDKSESEEGDGTHFPHYVTRSWRYRSVNVLRNHRPPRKRSINGLASPFFPKGVFHFPKSAPFMQLCYSRRPPPPIVR